MIIMSFKIHYQPRCLSHFTYYLTFFSRPPFDLFLPFYETDTRRNTVFYLVDGSEPGPDLESVRS